ncbi:SHOCT domain-containing protein [Rhodococcus sp. ARC_M13]|uniref:SHOCT domain-containing protein n=1 Tax=unclassified Rhodococcus (in: high G+C Gram-positive bacteria) TaxID=192944 RepID=UPI001FB1F1A6|nr:MULTISPECIES: SHOCT domain-containing protein [unclassified Rhodococcus (in: high G+C Gram-positive bacteria)]MCJ0899139.1 SHOCT domain-containing protein [Rhodococcus sp. ARC_M13]MCJ0948975.1 SHOCT domain-containing protein [Rhodococcus sp. ARC_M8]
MDIGCELKRDKALKIVAKSALPAGEEVVFVGTVANKYDRLQGFNRIFITNKRLLGWYNALGGGAKVYNLSVDLEYLADVVCDPKKETVEFYTRTGVRDMLKGVPASDQELIVQHLGAGRAEPFAGSGIAGETMKQMAAVEKQTAAAAKQTAAAAAAVKKEENRYRSPEQQVAVADGLPDKHAHLFEPLMESIDEAARYAAEDNILLEERALHRGRMMASNAELVQTRVLRWYEARVQKRTRAGEIRRGVELVGVVTKDLLVMNDRIVVGGVCRVMDGDVRASVEVDGQIMKSTRPTMTRMAIGSILPGSALLVGLATAKTKTTDTRRAHFIVVHPKWRITETITSDSAMEANGIASQINAIAEHLQRRETTSPSNTSTTPSLSGEMIKLAELHRAGVLSDNEFTAAKARLLAN